MVLLLLLPPTGPLTIGPTIYMLSACTLMAAAMSFCLPYYAHSMNSIIVAQMVVLDLFATGALILQLVPMAAVPRPVTISVLVAILPAWFLGMLSKAPPIYLGAAGVIVLPERRLCLIGKASVEESLLHTGREASRIFLVLPLCCLLRFPSCVCVKYPVCLWVCLLLCLST